MHLLIGAPVAKREWIIGTWFLHVEKALQHAGIDDAEYIFLADPDDPTVEAIIDSCERPLHWVWHQEGKDGRTWDLEGGRTWNAARYDYMVEIRNLLLTKVRSLQPDLFFSLDSDILLDAKTIELLVEGIGQFDAMGLKCYMTTTGRQFPSYAMLRGAALFRKDMDIGPTPVEVIMGGKLMNPKAYQVDYKFDSHGEDIGWSRNCADAGVKLGWEGRVTNKHVMSESWLDRVDPRCGW
jgi:hypothetical protein